MKFRLIFFCLLLSAVLSCRLFIPEQVSTQVPIMMIDTSMPRPTIVTSTIQPSMTATTETKSDTLLAFYKTDDTGKRKAFLVNTKGEVVQIPGLAETDFIESFQWSPNGDWLSLEIIKADRSHNIILYHPTDGTTEVIATGGKKPIWSPDGSSLAYIKISPAVPNCLVNVYNVEQKENRLMKSTQLKEAIQKINNSCIIAAVEWSPDGRLLMMRLFGIGVSDIYFIDVARDQVFQKAKHIFYDTFAFSQDSKTIAFGTSIGDNLAVFGRSLTLLDIQSGSQKILASSDDIMEIFQVWQWLPDGSLLFLHSYGNIETHRYEDLFWLYSPKEDPSLRPAENVPQKYYDLSFAKEYNLPDYKISSVIFSPDRSWVVLVGGKDKKSAVFLYSNKTDELIGPLSQGQGFLIQWQPNSEALTDFVPAPTLAREDVPTLRIPTTVMDTPVPNLKQLRMMFWEVSVRYDSKIWKVDDASYAPKLIHNKIPKCVLYEQGPTEAPNTDQQIILGQVSYRVANLKYQGNDRIWYLAVKGPNGPFPGGLPTFILAIDDQQQFEACRVDAETVLATMR